MGQGGIELAVWPTLADVGATIADNFGVRMPEFGTSFVRELNKKTV